MQNTFKSLLTMTQEELLGALIPYLNKFGYKVHSEDGYFIYAESPLEGKHVCMVAHLDTINTKNSSDKSVSVKPTYSYGGKVTHYNYNTYTEKEKTPTEADILFLDDVIMLHPMSNAKISCLGADDRVGVKTILDLLERGFRPNILFTTDEESGCVGSRRLIREYTPEAMEDVSMFIQIDRGVHEGKWNEMVYYDYDETSIPWIFDELSKYFSLALGSYTDVAVLGPHFNKPIVNLSASYMNEHTRNEFISLVAYNLNLDNLSKFLLAIRDQDTADWNYTAYKPVYTGKSVYGGIGNYYGTNGSIKKAIDDYEMEDLLDENEEILFYIYTGYLDIIKKYRELKEKATEEDLERVTKALEKLYDTEGTMNSYITLENMFNPPLQKTK